MASRKTTYYNGTQKLDSIGNNRTEGFTGRIVHPDGSLGDRVPVTRWIDYKTDRPSLHKCDARCTNAKGHNCECQCGGVNHGVNG